MMTAFTRWGTIMIICIKSTTPAPQSPPCALFMELSLMTHEYSFILATQQKLHLQDLRQRARDQRYLRRSSGLDAPDVAYSITFLHTDASTDKKTNSGQLSPAKVKNGEKVGLRYSTNRNMPIVSIKKAPANFVGVKECLLLVSAYTDYYSNFNGFRLSNRTAQTRPSNPGDDCVSSNL
jgi:hypothetical protein